MANIRDTIVGPAHPGAHYALVTMALGLGLTADRVLFPQSALAEDPDLKAAVIKLTRKYVRLHDGETVHVLARPDHTVTMSEVMTEVRKNGLAPSMAVRTQFQELPLLDMEASHTVWTCGDGRPWFWKSMIRLFQHFGSPRIITPPGEEQWLLNQPAIAERLQHWVDRRPAVPRVVVKHQGCGYRGWKGDPAEERAAALEECCDDNTLYLWQPGEGTTWFEVLRPARHGAC